MEAVYRCIKSATDDICGKAGTWRGQLVCVCIVSVRYKLMSLHTYVHLKNVSCRNSVASV